MGMVYTRRERCESDIYHIMTRGTGRQLIFDDDADRTRYMELLGRGTQKEGVEIIAWCLMDNHAHLIVDGDLASIARLMQNLGRSYVKFFNLRHDRVGHLFQGRYRSVPMRDQTQLEVTLRYVHLNPLEAGMPDPRHYPWSSYPDYLGLRDEGPVPVRKNQMLEAFGGVDAFVAFHEQGISAHVQSGKQGAACQHSAASKTHDTTSAMTYGRMTLDEARRAIQEELEGLGFKTMPVGERGWRNLLLRRLKARGLSIRQIERLTGIGRNIIARV